MHRAPIHLGRLVARNPLRSPQRGLPIRGCYFGGHYGAQRKRHDSGGVKLRTIREMVQIKPESRIHHAGEEALPALRKLPELAVVALAHLVGDKADVGAEDGDRAQSKPKSRAVDRAQDGIGSTDQHPTSIEAT